MIAGYTASKRRNGVLLERSVEGLKDSCLAKTFDEAADFLTEQYPQTLHIVWDLREFADTLFELLPQDAKTQLGQSPRVRTGNSKIFYIIDKLLGITTLKSIQGNIYQRDENNFYGIKRQHWMDGAEAPRDANELEEYGWEILKALEVMGIYPTKLTSPVGVFSESLQGLNLPTIYSNQELLDASDFCLSIMRNEWRSAYRIGFFDQTYTYDLRAAYPSIMAGLPNTDKCQITHSNHYVKSDWGIMKGTVEITADISPIVLAIGDGEHINPKGKFPTAMTTDEGFWLQRNGAGRFEIEDGYFFNWLSREKPYESVMRRVFALRRLDNPLAQSIAKNMAQGCSGKLDQDNDDGSYGELFNPLLACMTRSRCRLKVADFIYANKLQDDLLAVALDACITTKPVEIEQTGEMGSWRFEGESPALILGKGEIWRPTKKPLNISYDEIIGAMRQHPKKCYYEFGNKCFDLAMVEPNSDRVYEGYPKNGGEALTKIFGSKPIELGGEL